VSPGYEELWLQRSRSLGSMDASHFAEHSATNSRFF